jgi:hypothetical protein
MPNLYIIAGCNGAGKTTASKTILPELWKCKEFVNADAIAAELCPSDPESVAIEAGRIMLGRVHQLIEESADFSIETTLATRSLTPAGLLLAVVASSDQQLILEGNQTSLTCRRSYIDLPSPPLLCLLSPLRCSVVR